MSMKPTLKINRRRLIAAGAAGLFIAAKPAILRAYPARNFLSGPLILNITPSGNDATADGSLANPFRNPGPAADMLAEEYDLQGQPVTFLLQSATSPAQNLYGGMNISGRFVGQAAAAPTMAFGTSRPPFFYGKQGGIVTLTSTNPSYPWGAVLSPQMQYGGDGLSLSESAALAANGFAIDTTISLQNCIDLQYDCLLAMKNISFGNAGGPGQGPNSYCCHMAINKSFLLIQGDYNVGGFAMDHMDIGGNSDVYFDNNADPGLPMNVNFNAGAFINRAVITSDGSWVFANNVNWNGSILPAGQTGQPGASVYLIRGGVIDTGGAKNIPGTAPIIGNGGGSYT